MNNGYVISKFLRSLAIAVERMSDQEIDELLRVGGATALARRAKTSRRGSKPAKPRADIQAEAANIVDTISRIPSREEAARILDGLAPTRSVLAQAAKLRQIHVAKDDTNSVIREKLVEHLVGSRLDSAAIRGR